MNARTKFFALLTIVIIASSIFPKQASAQPAGISFQVFYDHLSPYGQWYDDPDYGYVWYPDAGPEFVPYSTDGHWVYTEYGWTWASEYEWGWAPFHYGRWDYDQNYGWFWVPGHEWGPAWVVWSRSDNYYGWCPIRPGISIEVAYGRDYRMPADRWIFVDERYIESPHIHRFYVDRTRNVTIINHTTIINRTYQDEHRHTYYAAGPDRAEVQRATGRQVRTVAIRENNSPGERIRRGELNIYRPEVRRSAERDTRPAPSRISRTDERRSNNNSQRRDNAPQENRRVEQPAHQQNNQQNNNDTRVRQTRTAPANNATHTDQPQTQQRTSNPTDNNGGRDRQKYNGNAAPSNNRVEQPAQQQQNSTPAVNNNRREQTTTPQNNRVAQPQQQQNNAPRTETKREPTATPQNTNNNKPVQQAQPQQQQQRTAAPSEQRRERKAEAKEARKEKPAEEKPAENRRRQ
jgi:hypothetical protein